MVARRGCFPLVLGGDHSMAMGTVAGLLDVWGDVGVLWIDAHGDINTPETTPSGNIHGMPVAAMLGQARIARAAAVGVRGTFGPSGWCCSAPARSIPVSRRSFASWDSHVHDERDRPDRHAGRRRRRDRASCAGQAASTSRWTWTPSIRSKRPGVGTPWPGGLTYREAHLAMELLAATGQVSSMEVVEVNPDPRPRKPHRQTSRRADPVGAGAHDSLNGF